MALTGWSAANYLRRTSPVLSGVPIFVSAWVYSAADSAYRGIFALGSFGSDTHYHALYLGPSNNSVVESKDGTAPGSAVQAAHPVSTWFHLSGAFTSTTSRTLRRNGAAGVEETSSRIVSTLADTVIGMLPHCCPFSATGGLAEVSIWDSTGMSVANLDSLNAKLYNGGAAGAGGNPININAESAQPWTGLLSGYWINSANTITDLSGNGNTMTMIGTLTNFATGHPTIEAVSGGGGQAPRTQHMMRMRRR